jgi:hypothetical protein
MSGETIPKNIIDLTNDSDEEKRDANNTSPARTNNVHVTIDGGTSVSKCLAQVNKQRSDAISIEDLPVETAGGGGAQATAVEDGVEIIDGVRDNSKTGTRIQKLSHDVRVISAELESAKNRESEIDGVAIEMIRILNHQCDIALIPAQRALAWAGLGNACKMSKSDIIIRESRPFTAEQCFVKAVEANFECHYGWKGLMGLHKDCQINEKKFTHREICLHHANTALGL